MKNKKPVRAGYCPYCRIRKLTKRINARTCGKPACIGKVKRVWNLDRYYKLKKTKAMLKK